MNTTAESLGGGALFFALMAGSALADATGDFNGDGRDELVISVPFEPIGAVDEAGAVHIIRGSSGGLTSAGDQFWHQDKSGVPSSPQTEDFFGWATAAGDFDDDGRLDLAISAMAENVGAISNAGAVHVLYGKANGLSAAGDQFWHRDVAGVNGSPASGDSFGFALAAGDFDGDGFDDLAISATGSIVDGLTGAGDVTVLYGSSHGLTAEGDELFSQGTVGIKGDPGMNERFGWALTAGDFDVDGRDDLAIGGRSDTVDGINAAGGVNVLYGTSNGLSAAGDQYWHQNVQGVKDVAEELDRFGFALAAGDFDDDGHDDLAIGIVTESIGAVNECGAVAVLYGSGSGLRANGDQLWHQNVAGVRDTAQPEDIFGYSLEAADFDGDGRDDLAIGVGSEGIGAFIAAGAVAVLYGSSNGLSATGDQLLHQNVPGVNGARLASDEHFGLFLTTGDFDGDGRHDLAIASCLEVVDGIDFAGAVNVLYGSNSGISTQGDQVWSQASDGIADVPEQSDLFGMHTPGID